MTFSDADYANADALIRVLELPHDGGEAAMSDVTTLSEQAWEDLRRWDALSSTAPCFVLIRALADALSAVTAERDRMAEALQEIADDGDGSVSWLRGRARAALAGPDTGDGT